MYRMTLISILLTLAGCSDTASLLVSSQPIGAYISEIGTGTAFGIAPVYVAYPEVTLRQYRDGQGCYLAKGMEARWVSGARTVLDPIRICGKPNGSYQITLVRDSALPDLDKDMQFAMQVHATRAQQQQAAAAYDANLIAAFSVIQQTAPARCTSKQVGDSVQTVCQ